MWRAFESLENRITLLDNKSSILIGIETAILAVAALLTGEAMDTVETERIGYLLIGITAIFAILIVPLLLHTIRPTQCYFQRKMELQHLQDFQEHNIIWPAERVDGQHLTHLSKTLSEDQMTEDIIANIFAKQQLLKRKYRKYSLAMFILKIQAPVTLAVIVVICVLKLFK